MIEYFSDRTMRFGLDIMRCHQPCKTILFISNQRQCDGTLFIIEKIDRGFDQSIWKIFKYFGSIVRWKVVEHISLFLTAQRFDDFNFNLRLKKPENQDRKSVV